MFKVHALYMTPKNVCQKTTHVQQNASLSGDQGFKKIEIALKTTRHLSQKL
jgi:hypothetical protein